MATTETVDVVMPQMGVSVSEGTITKWLQAGGRAGRGRTSRCSRSRPTRSTPRCRARAPATLTQILVQEGETVDVGTKLAVIARRGRRPAAPTGRRRPSPRLRRPRAESADVSERRRPRPPRRSRTSRTRAAAASETTEPSSTNGKTFVLARRREDRVRARRRPRARCRAPDAAAA